MTEQETALIELACSRLLTIYCNAYDARDYDRLLSIFSPDAAWHRPVGKVMHGKESMLAFLNARAPDILLRHCITNQLVDVTSVDEAEGEAYGIVFRQHGFDGLYPAKLLQPELVVQYRDRFVRTADGWRIAYHETRWIFKE